MSRRRFRTSPASLIAGFSIHQDVWDVGMTGRWQTGLEVSNMVGTYSSSSKCHAIGVCLSVCVVVLSVLKPRTSCVADRLLRSLQGIEPQPARRINGCHHELTALFTQVSVLTNSVNDVLVCSSYEHLRVSTGMVVVVAAAAVGGMKKKDRRRSPALEINTKLSLVKG